MPLINAKICKLIFAKNKKKTYQYHDFEWIQFKVTIKSCAFAWARKWKLKIWKLIEYGFCWRQRRVFPKTNFQFARKWIWKLNCNDRNVQPISLRFFSFKLCIQPKIMQYSTLSSLQIECVSVVSFQWCLFINAVLFFRIGYLYCILYTAPTHTI